MKKISEGTNYTAATVGKFDDLQQHVYHLAPGIDIPGKVFIGETLKCTGTEVSFQIMPPSMGVDFLHSHQAHEELYIVIKGSGEYQVDDRIFAIDEGSIVRIAPAGKRSWRNTGDVPMVMMTIQSMNGSLNELGVADGVMLQEPIKW